MNEITCELPPCEERDLDYHHLKKLTFRATQKTLAILKSMEVSEKVLLIYRGDNTSVRGYQVPFPNYREKSVWNRIEEVWGSDETLALANYLWTHGACKKSFTGPKPDKSVWARTVFGDLVHGPLLTALEQAGISEFVDGKIIKTWSISDEDLFKAVEARIEIMEDEKNGYRILTAICPLDVSALLQEGTEIEIGNGITIKHWLPKEYLTFRSLHERGCSRDDFKSPPFRNHVAEIRLTKSHDDSRDIKVQVADQLDILKWVLFVTSKFEIPLAEGTCLILDKTGNEIAKFYRDENYSGHISFNNNQIDACKVAMNDLSTLLQSQISEKSKEDFYQALWHFGRSCVSTLDRDILLEAAIGLDRLLVPGGGDSKYRFCLHGAAILSSVKKDDIDFYGALESIYKSRSSAAHGGTSADEKKIKEQARMSRKLLADIILAIICLAKDQKIDLNREGNEKKWNISKAIQKYVIQSVTKIPEHHRDAPDSPAAINDNMH